MKMKNTLYLYHLPYAERTELCRILDHNNKWEELGRRYMQYDVLTIQDLQRKIFIRWNSPSEQLLTMWGHLNHTVCELFVLLSYMQHYEAMSVIKKFVDKKYLILLERSSCNKNFEIAPINKGENVSINVRHPRSPIPLDHLKASHGLAVSNLSCIAEAAGPIPQIPYDELQKSTNNWDPAAILGKGGFGTVFKGIWKCTCVAIKMLRQKENTSEYHSEQIKQSVTELYWLNAYRHDNLLPVYGYSISGLQPCLIYQYMPGGCLEERLKVSDPKNVLSWSKRLDIATGTARGLQFLHTISEKPLVHGDIKSANILLDPNDIAKIGDFGLAREGPGPKYTHIKVSKKCGTLPYLPDEFLRANKLSTKVDTYSFGVLLFEIATALSAYSKQRQHNFLKDHVVSFDDDNIYNLKDNKAEGGEDCFKNLIDIGKLCTSRIAKDRPTMTHVLQLLECVNL